MQYRAYNNRDTDTEDEPLGFDEWCSKGEDSCHKFQYWATAVFIVYRSQRQSSFSMYLDDLTEFVPWFFAVDHSDYARCIPVPLRDNTELPTIHPDVAS